IDMMRCIYCGFCVDACPEEAIIMSREHHQAAYNRNETIYTIEKLMARPGIDAKGPGYRPNRPLAEAKIFNKDEQNQCAVPSVTEEGHPAILSKSMIRRRTYPASFSRRDRESPRSAPPVRTASTCISEIPPRAPFLRRHG